MNYTELNKDELIVSIEAMAEAKEFELPRSWKQRGSDKMVALAEEVEAYVNPEEPKAQPKVRGRQDAKSKILACPTRLVSVPEDDKNGTNHVTIWVNGVEFIYAREQDYEMPEPVAEVYLNALRETSKAKKKMRKNLEIK